MMNANPSTPSRPFSNPQNFWTSATSNSSPTSSRDFQLKSTSPPFSFNTPSLNSTPPPSSGWASSSSSKGPPPNGFSPLSEPRTLGYFAFPPPGSPSFVANASPPEPPVAQSQNVPSSSAGTDAQQEDLWAARVKRDEELHRQRVAREEAEARRGEEDWVRSGGVLRDAEGRRDEVRTRAVREELRLRDVEARLMRRWERYEREWRRLQAGDGNGRGGEKLRFGDIPWPVDVGEEVVELRHLAVHRVTEFLLEGLKVRGCKVTRRERLRSSLLRWHPDKMTAVLTRVEKEDVEMVRQGVRVVVECLQLLHAGVQG
ncbi:hypothetical protein Hypma_003843 [Hypsizygus marmoreus]|uniref:Uncharacterized protein n=1 Tax=Hypsizygus marmoreus TaxID=39966 RepID=A0A369K1U9_HYPMA|nr:hypothetical protein Hypma_003843 [Hypsizygus marmoreus]